ncbi:MAG: hypothetical protein ACXU7D_07795 [Burkholderiaceae bacterium]
MWILLVITALGFAASVAYIVFIGRKSRLAKQNAARISKEIILYFRKTGVEVLAVSTNLQGDERFTALIESEPMKRFRLSHIIEFTLRDHIQKTCGLELESIYWRFPLKEANQHVFPSKLDDDKPVTIMPAGPETAEANKLVSTDEYINEGLVPYKDVPKIEVTELSWEKFEEAAILDVDKKTDAAESPANE